MKNFIRRFVDHPAPFAVIGGLGMMLALAQNDPLQMAACFYGLMIAIWNYEESI